MSRTVSAKFVVSSVCLTKDSRQIRLSPNYGTTENPKNAEWSRWTPSGAIDMTITNPDAWPLFEYGTELTVLFQEEDSQ